MPPKVSVLVPIYNVEKYLKQCVDSILAQTLKEIEVILLDDGSTDTSPQICNEYAKKDKRIKVIHKKNSGYGATMNVGLKAATGEYIGIVESDDWAEADMFERLYFLAKRYNVDVVKSNFFYYWSTPNERNELAKVMPEADLNKVISPSENQKIFGAMPCIWAAIYSNKFIKNNKIRFLETPGASYQDTGFNFKILTLAKKIWLTDVAFLHYRQDNEQSSVRSKNKTFCVCDEYVEIESFVRKINRSELLPLVQRLKFVTYMWNFERLCWPQNFKFLLHMSSEFKIAKKKKILDKNLFGSNFNFLQRIIRHPIMFFIKQKIKLKYLIESILSLKNSRDKRYKIITLFGLKLKVKR